MNARDKLKATEADYWDCIDGERLEHREPGEALAHYLGDRLNRASPLEEQIRRLGPIPISAWRRAKLGEISIIEAADRALESASRSLDESDLSDPEGRTMFLVDILIEHRPKFEAVVRELASRAHVHQCDFVTTVVLAPAEVSEILRAARPEWFGEASPAPAGAAGIEGASP